MLLDVRCVILSACFHTEIFDEDIDLSDINVVAKAPSLSIYLRPIQKKVTRIRTNNLRSEVIRKIIKAKKDKYEYRHADNCK